MTPHIEVHVHCDEPVGRSIPCQRNAGSRDPLQGGDDRRTFVHLSHADNLAANRSRFTRNIEGGFR